MIGATDKKTAIKNVKSSSVGSDGVNAWSQTLDDGDLPDGGPDGLYALIVTGEDVIRNVGSTAGRSGSGAPGGDDELDLAKLDSPGAPGREGHGAWPRPRSTSRRNLRAKPSM